ncbi:MAG: hypothetical protein FWC13_07575 [Oscillospiraceae bacterium]|nr:hypothetical protein [Oscillospiraceae bacterium]
MTDVTKVKISSRNLKDIENLIELFKPNIVKEKIIVKEKVEPCKTQYFNAYLELKKNA